MIKNTVKYFLLIIVTLLIGYSQLFAGVKNCYTAFSIAQNNNKSEDFDNVNEQNLIPDLDYIHHSFDNDTHKIHGVDIEIEEDEVTSCKRSLETGNYFTHFLYQTKLSDLRVNEKKKSFSSDSFSYFSFNKLFIIFNVFRI